MGYVRKQRMHNKTANKEVEETHPLETFKLNGGGKNNDVMEDGKAKLLTDFKGRESLHIEGTYIKPSGVYQEVEILSEAPNAFLDNDKRFSGLSNEEKERAIKEGVKENFYDPGEDLVYCSEQKFDNQFQ